MACVTPTRTANRMAETKPTYTNFTLDIDGDDSALVTWNAPGRTFFSNPSSRLACNKDVVFAYSLFDWCRIHSRARG